MEEWACDCGNVPAREYAFSEEVVFMLGKAKPGEVGIVGAKTVLPGVDGETRGSNFETDIGFPKRANGNQNSREDLTEGWQYCATLNTSYEMQLCPSCPDPRVQVRQPSMCSAAISVLSKPKVGAQDDCGQARAPPLSLVDSVPRGLLAVPSARASRRGSCRRCPVPCSEEYRRCRT